jgi:hypothetical protein
MDITDATDDKIHDAQMTNKIFSLVTVKLANNTDMTFFASQNILTPQQEPTLQ